MQFSWRSKEFRWVVIFGVVVMLITLVPYAIGFFRQDSRWYFSGAVINSEDINSYFGNMILGSSGSWLFQTPYSPYPQPYSLIFMPYLLLGKLVSSPFLHSKTVLLFHAFRIIAGLLEIFATYDFISLFTQNVSWRRAGTMIASVGGGLGWLMPLMGGGTWLNAMPIEYYSPEAFSFLMLFSVPHLTLARAFLLWSLKAYLQAAGKQGKALVLNSIKMGVFWLLAALSQPLTGLVAGAIPVSHAIIHGILAFYKRTKGQLEQWAIWKQEFYSILIGGAIAGPLAIYNILSFTINPFLREWSLLNTETSASPLLYFLAYSPFLLLGIVGGYRLTRDNFHKGVFLIQWVLVFMAAMYIPFSLQRRVIEGVWIGIVTLAVVGAEALSSSPFFARRIKVLRGSMFAIALIPTSLFLVGMIPISLNRSQPVFVPADEGKVFEYLSLHARKGDVVLSAYQAGNWLPAWAPVRVVIGNTTLSVNFAQLQKEISQFYSSNYPDPNRIKFLDELGANYVFWGPDERKLGDWDPERSPFLTKLIGYGDYSIYSYSH